MGWATKKMPNDEPATIAIRQTSRMAVTATAPPAASRQRSRQTFHSRSDCFETSRQLLYCSFDSARGRARIRAAAHGPQPRPLGRHTGCLCAFRSRCGWIPQTGFGRFAQAFPRLTGPALRWMRFLRCRSRVVFCPRSLRFGCTLFQTFRALPCAGTRQIPASALWGRHRLAMFRRRGTTCCIGRMRWAGWLCRKFRDRLLFFTFSDSHCLMRNETRGAAHFLRRITHQQSSVLNSLPGLSLRPPFGSFLRVCRHIAFHALLYLLYGLFLYGLQAAFSPFFKLTRYRCFDLGCVFFLTNFSYLSSPLKQHSARWRVSSPAGAVYRCFSFSSRVLPGRQVPLSSRCSSDPSCRQGSR